MTGRHRHSGHSLAGTLIFLVLVLLLWVVVSQHASGTLRTERACKIRLERSLGCTRALAWGLTLLETGLPPADNYACRVHLPGQPMSAYVVEYRKTENLAYAVSVRPATPSDSILPEAPATFAVAG